MWASPWQTPFSLVRYAHARERADAGHPVERPAGCFGSGHLQPRHRLLRPGRVECRPRAGSRLSPEPELTAGRRRATSAVLWRRRNLSFPGKEAPCSRLPARSGSPGRRPGRAALRRAPDHRNARAPGSPCPLVSKPLREDSGAASVRLPGGVMLSLDGVNSARGEDQMHPLHRPARAHRDQHLRDRGERQRRRSGAGGHRLRLRRPPDRPAGGFILLRPRGTESDEHRRLESLRPGNTVAVLDAEGAWVGGSAPTLLLVAAPGRAGPAR